MPGFFAVDLSKKGPIFRNPTPVIARFLDRSGKGVAEEGKNRVLRRLGTVLQHPTGYYESQIQTEKVLGNWEVNDSRRVVYGPWLEGTGSRNATTRFKGYRTFRLVKQELDMDMPVLLRPYVAELMKELNG